jgi:hypothetical protein
MGPAGRTGLDYTACAWTWAANRERYQLPPDGELLQDVTVMEHAFMQADYERTEQRRATSPDKAIGTARDTTIGE